MGKENKVDQRDQVISKASAFDKQSGHAYERDKEHTKESKIGGKMKSSCWDSWVSWVNGASNYKHLAGICLIIFQIKEGLVVLVCESVICLEALTLVGWSKEGMAIKKTEKEKKKKTEKLPQYELESLMQQKVQEKSIQKAKCCL